MQVPSVFCSTCTRYLGREEVCRFCQTPRAPEQRLSSPGQPLWSLQTAAAPSGQPLLSGDQLIVADKDGALYGVRLADGVLAWQYSCGGRLRSVMALIGSRLYVALRERDVLAIDLPTPASDSQPIATPRLAWRLSVERPSGIESDGRLLYFGDGQGRVWAVCDLGSRPEVTWPAVKAPHTITATPALWRHLLLVGTHHPQGQLMAYDAQRGQEAWSQPIGGRVVCQPLVVKNARQELVVAATDQGQLRACWLPDGTLDWSYRFVAQPRPPLAVGDGRLFVGAGDGNVLGLDGAMEQPGWKSQLSAEPVAGLACWDSLLFAASQDGVVGAFEAADGRLAWRWQAPGAISADLVASNGRLFVGCKGAGWLALPWHLGQWDWAASWAARQRAREAAATFQALAGEEDAAAQIWEQLHHAELAARMWSRFGEDKRAAQAFEMASHRLRSTEPHLAAAYLIDAGDHWSRAGQPDKAEDRYRQAGRMSAHVAHLQLEPFNRPVFDRGLPGTVALRLRNTGNSSARAIRFVLGGQLASTVRGELEIEVAAGAVEILEFIDLVPTAVGLQRLTVRTLYHDDTGQQRTAERAFEITATDLPPGMIVARDDVGVVTVRVPEGTPLPSVRLQRGAGMVKYEIVKQAPDLDLTGHVA